MIKLFRNLRKNLLRESHTTNYLKYAIGEIILVVIGILIALQINNWSEKRKELKERRVLISSIISDLQASRVRLLEMCTQNETAITRTNRFLELSYRDSKVSIDSLQYYFFGAFEFPFFKPILTSYNQAVSSGKISLIGDKEFLDQCPNS